MRTIVRYFFDIRVIFAVVNCVMSAPLEAQTFTNLYNFKAVSVTSPYTNGDGAYPSGSLVISGNTLYGEAGNGGPAGAGSIFAINTDSSGFTNIYNFTAISTNSPFDNADGANPFSSLLLTHGVLYGTAFKGGKSGFGTIFAVNTDGSGFTNLHSFAGTAMGGNPDSSLILSGDDLYGTAELGAESGNGIIFRINTNGTGFTNLHGFTGGKGGAFPQSALVLSGNILYGTTDSGGGGGNGGNGIVFAINADGAGFTNLHSFNGSNDGAFVQAGLIVSGDTLYGTAEAGGVGALGGDGTIFSLKTNGSSFTVLHTFGAIASNSVVNSDGANPSAALILSGDTLYGTTDNGGSSGYGTVFALDTNGSNFMVLHNFTGGDNGATPQGALLLSDGELFGTTQYGGTGQTGTIFGFVLGPGSTGVSGQQPDIIDAVPSGNNLAINAINGVSGATYVALTSTNLTLPLNEWTPVATNTLSAGGNFTITVLNTIDGSIPQRFYILEMP